MTLTESVLEDEGMHVFEWWGGEYRPLAELIGRNGRRKDDKQIDKFLFACHLISLFHDYIHTITYHDYCKQILFHKCVRF